MVCDDRLAWKIRYKDESHWTVMGTSLVQWEFCRS